LWTGARASSRSHSAGPRFNSLKEKSNQARQTYEGFRAQHERASLMGSMDQLGMSNLRRNPEASLPDVKGRTPAGQSC